MIQQSTVLFGRKEWPTIEFMYTNYKMETEQRKAKPLGMWYGSSEYHQGEQWFMNALDLDKSELRNFAVRDMKDVREVRTL